MQGVVDRTSLNDATVALLPLAPPSQSHSSRESLRVLQRAGMGQLVHEDVISTLWKEPETRSAGLKTMPVPPSGSNMLSLRGMVMHRTLEPEQAALSAPLLGQLPRVPGPCSTHGHSTAPEITKHPS
eukprot:767369-Hanusia_phi.AAC.1